MKWNDIEISEAGTAFIYNGSKLFSKKFISVMKFHEPGLAPVMDESGWYHINLQGEPVYKERYDRAFGYYFNRAALNNKDQAFHIDIIGKRVYPESYLWVGNYQQKVCVVRNKLNQYFHIDLNGKPIYNERYQYAGDFYEGACCVKSEHGWKHIRLDGSDLNGRYFLDLGVFHKGYATARDKEGWFHIDKIGSALYSERYLAVEPFYNGVSYITNIFYEKYVINETGMKI